MDSRTTIAQAIGATLFAADVPIPVIERLAALARWKSCRPMAVLFREGAHSDALYLIVSGHVNLEMCVAGRGCTQLLTLGPGELLAWSSLVGGQRMTATAVALDDVELIEFSGSELAAACDADHELGYHVMRRLASALATRLLATRLQLLDFYMADASVGSQASP